MAKSTPRRRKRTIRTPACLFCTSKTLPDYKEVDVLKNFITDRGKIVPRSRNGLCAKHQRRLTVAIKRARFLDLLPFVVKI